MVVRVAAPADMDFGTGDVCGVLLQLPDTWGRIADPSALVAKARAAGALAVVATDLLALTVLRPPGELGADKRAWSRRELGGDFPTRHHTLGAVVGWSYDLLAPAEQALLRRLAIFAGGFSAEAAESICADDALPTDQVLPLIGRLVDQSLVLAEERGHDIRYRLLELIRAFARQKADESGSQIWLGDGMPSGVFRSVWRPRRACGERCSPRGWIDSNWSMTIFGRRSIGCRLGSRPTSQLGSNWPPRYGSSGGCAGI